MRKTFIALFAAFLSQAAIAGESFTSTDYHDEGEHYGHVYKDPRGESRITYARVQQTEAGWQVVETAGHALDRTESTEVVMIIGDHVQPAFAKVRVLTVNQDGRQALADSYRIFACKKSGEGSAYSPCNSRLTRHIDLRRDGVRYYNDHTAESGSLIRYSDARSKLRNYRFVRLDDAAMNQIVQALDS